MESPHLALTHMELQNGAANKRNASLLLKGDIDITEEVKKALLQFGVNLDTTSVESVVECQIEKSKIDEVTPDLKVNGNPADNLNTNEVTILEKNETVQAAEALLKADIENLRTELTKANAEKETVTAERDALAVELSDIKKAQEDAKAATRLSEIQTVVKAEDEAAALHKSLESLDDEAFGTVIKSLKAKAEVVENTDLFKQVSAPEVTEGVQEESNLRKMLKAQFNVAD